VHVINRRGGGRNTGAEAGRPHHDDPLPRVARWFGYHAAHSSLHVTGVVHIEPELVFETLHPRQRHLPRNNRRRREGRPRLPRPGWLLYEEYDRCNLRHIRSDRVRVRRGGSGGGDERGRTP